MNPGSVGNGAKFSNMHTGMAASSIVTVLTRVELIQNAVLAEVDLIAEDFEHGMFHGDFNGMGDGWLGCLRTVKFHIVSIPFE